MRYYYEFDSKIFQSTGQAVLYRNSISDGKFKYSRFDVTAEDFMPQIAKGFTAFFCKDWDLLSPEVFKTVEKIKVYTEYFDKQVNPIVNNYKNQPGLLDEKEILIIATEEHIKKETFFMTESSKFFSENADVEESNAKKVIREYVNDYLRWVKMKISNENPKSGLKMKDSISMEKLEEISEDLIAMNVINPEDQYTFKQIFKGFKVQKKVNWNGDIPYAKKGLFALFYHLTGRKVQASEVNMYFTPVSQSKPYIIHDKQYGDAYKGGDASLFTRFTDRWFPRQKK